MPAGLTFGLLGPVEVRLDGVPLDVGGRRTQAVLAALLLQPNQVITTDRVIDERRALHELTAIDETLRASLRLSWQELRTGDQPVDVLAATVFLRLGAIRVPSVAPGMVAAVVDCSPELARLALDRLVEVRLVEALDGRYRMHDLVRLLAAEQAAREPAADRHRWLLAALRWYTGTADRVATLMRGAAVHRDTPAAPVAVDLPDPAAAGAWLDAERTTIPALVRQALAEDHPVVHAGASLVTALYPALLMRGHHFEWEMLCRWVLDAADRVGDPRLVATVWTRLGVLYSIQLRTAEALDCLDRSLPMWRMLGDRTGEASALEAAGMAYVRSGHADQALRCYEPALLLRAELGIPFAEAITLCNAAEAYLSLGRHDESLDCLRRSLELRRDLGDLAGEAITLLNLGEVHLAMHRPEEARRYADEAIAGSRAAGERANEHRSLALRARAWLRLGEGAQALADGEAAIMLAREAGGSVDPAELAELTAALESAGHSAAPLHRLAAGGR